MQWLELTVTLRGVKQAEAFAQARTASHSTPDALATRALTVAGNVAVTFLTPVESWAGLWAGLNAVFAGKIVSHQVCQLAPIGA